MVIKMTLTIEDVKKLTADYNTAKQELHAKILRAPDSPDIWDDERNNGQTIAEWVRALRTEFMPPAALAMHQKLINDLEIFGNIINDEVLQVTKHNEKIQDDINKLTKEFLAAIRVPESDLGAALLINKKIIAPEDYDSLVAVYRTLGFNNYTCKNQLDTVYYNPRKWHFNTLKEEIFELLSSDMRKKYPTLSNFIQNSVVKTNPFYGRGLIDVMEARKE